MLVDPKVAGMPTPSRLHDVLLATHGRLPSGHVLDAGCGSGGTMPDLAGRSTTRFRGLTLSERQAAIGHAAIAKAGLACRVAIEVGNYDTPPRGPFDLALAIESLAHSPNPPASVGAIAARDTADLALFMAGARRRSPGSRSSPARSSAAGS